MKIWVIICHIVIKKLTMFKVKMPPIQGLEISFFIFSSLGFEGQVFANFHWEMSNSMLNLKTKFNSLWHSQIAPLWFFLDFSYIILVYKIIQLAILADVFEVSLLLIQSTPDNWNSWGHLILKFKIKLTSFIHFWRNFF